MTQDTSLAYVLTELMPTKGRDAVLGLEILDELLQHGGRDYVSRVPSLHDRDLSFGDYQFTEKALSERINTRPGEREGSIIREEDFGGASQVNKLFAERRVPKHIADLRGDQHHVTAHPLSPRPTQGQIVDRLLCRHQNKWSREINYFSNNRTNHF